MQKSHNIVCYVSPSLLGNRFLLAFLSPLPGDLFLMPISLLIFHENFGSIDIYVIAIEVII